MKTLKQRCLLFLAACAFLVPLATSAQEDAAATNSIQTLTTMRQGTDIVVKVVTEQALGEAPAGFAVSNPSRIAFDFTDMKNATGKTTLDFSEGTLHSASIIEVGNRLRLVLNLSSNMNYSTRLEEDGLYVVLSPVERVSDTMDGKTIRFAEETITNKPHAIEDIVFRRGKDGEGRVLIDLSDSGTGIDIREQGRHLVVDFLKTSVPEALRRKLDVTDFSTPVVSVETKPMGDNVRMTITPDGLWEHNAYQSERQFVVEVKRIIEDPNKLVQGTKVGYVGPRVSINYQNGDVRALLRLMAEELGLNAVISESVRGSTTLVLKDVPADQVIDMIFQQKDLDMRRKDKIIMIAPRAEIARREREMYESRHQADEIQPVRMEVFDLSYQRADDVATLIRGVDAEQWGASSRLLSKRGSALAEVSTNTLFVTDIPSRLEEIRTFIKRIDVASRQVLIEARVVEATDEFSRSLGIKLGFMRPDTSGKGTGIGGDSVRFGGNTTYQPGSWQTRTVTSANGKETTERYWENGFAVRTPLTANLGSVISGNAAAAAGTVAFSLFGNSASNILNAELTALQTDGLGKIISSPRVVTANNVAANIEDGYQIPYRSLSTSDAGSTTTEFKDATLRLSVTPQITPEGTVKMTLDLKRDEPNMAILGSDGEPSISTSNIQTTVVVENGGTIMIGGIYKTQESSNTEGLPWLQDIPLVGWLFKYKQRSISRREVIFFITPRILSEKLRVE